MKLCNREIEAVILDLDGTLLDSNNVWVDIDEKFFAKRNMEIPPTYADDIAHIGLQEAAILTKEKYGIKESIDEIVDEWREGCKNAYLYEVQMMPHAFEYLKYLKSNGVKMAVATANDRSLYEPCLKRLGIYDMFDFIADVDTVGAGKNSVKLYEYISNKLGIPAENTAIYEDIYIGLKTAYENGYLCIAIDDPYSKKDQDLKRKYSHIYIYEYKELF